MARFQKIVLKPGRYLVNATDGKRKEEVFSPERLRRFVESHQQMKAAGLDTPAPWDHRDDSIPVTRKELLGSKNNAGWWDFTLDDEGNINGVLEVPLEEDAKRVGTTVKEVSPFIRKEFIDGTGRIWNDVITHGALVTYPVQQGQENFKPVSTPDSVSVAMSCFLGDLGVTGNDKKEGRAGEPTDPSGDPKEGPYGVGDAVKCLRKVGVDLPDDTSDENIVERIVVACRAIQGMEREQDIDGEGQTDKNGTEQPQPIAMGISMPEDEKVTKRLAALQGVAQKSIQESFISRTKSLISSGRISVAYAKENLEPMIQGFQLSISDDGAIEHNQVESAITLLEKLPPSGFLENPASGVQKSEKGASMSLFQEEELPDGYMGEDLATGGKALDDAAVAQLEMAGY